MKKRCFGCCCCRPFPCSPGGWAQRWLGTALAVILTSLIFSTAHYVGPHGEAFDAYSFSFRCIAGAFFALLFVYRGFGIAAGTHAMYDIFVGFG